MPEATPTRLSTAFRLLRAVPSKKSPPAESVDEYLAAVPEDARAALAILRKTIKAAAPKATEVISYQIPTYMHHGPLVAFAAFKNHCGFYVMSPSVMDGHKDELRGYSTAKTTIRFPADNPLPAALVKKLLKAASRRKRKT